MNLVNALKQEKAQGKASRLAASLMRMNLVIYNGVLRQLTLVDKQGKTIGTWSAYNNIDSHATIQPHIPDGSYAVQDRSRPHPHAANPNGPYGSYGIIRLNVPGHVGVHSGRANARHLPGPPHPTMAAYGLRMQP